MLDLPVEDVIVDPGKHELVGKATDRVLGKLLLINRLRSAAMSHEDLAQNQKINQSAKQQMFHLI